MPAFQTASGVPLADVNLLTGQAKGPDWSSYSTTSEATTIQLEFRELSRASGDPKFKVSIIDINTSGLIARLQRALSKMLKYESVCS